MWQTGISVSKEYDIKDVLEKSLDTINATIRHTDTIDRDIYNVVCEDNREREKLIAILCRILLVNIKYHYLTSKIPISNDMLSLLVGEMLYFDSKYEREYVARILALQCEYSLDGILHFRMHDLVDNWDYLISLYDRVQGDSENISLLIQYIHDSAVDDTKRIFVTEKNNALIMFDVCTGKSIDRVDIFSNDTYNILYMLVSAHVSEIFVDKRRKFNLPINMLSNIMRVKYV